MYKNEVMSLRFLWRDNEGEPAEFELEELIEEKRRRYNRYYEDWSRGEAARRESYNEQRAEVERNNERFQLNPARQQRIEEYRAGTFDIGEYVRVINERVDLRIWRPLTREKIYRMSDADIFHFEGDTKTVERVVIEMMKRMLGPKTQDDFGITRSNSIKFSLVNNIPREEEGVQGKGVYRDWETDRKSTRLNSSH